MSDALTVIWEVLDEAVLSAAEVRARNSPAPSPLTLDMSGITCAEYTTAANADDDDESTCPAGTYKRACGDEDKCVPCNQCLTLTPDNDTDAREVALTTTLGIVSWYTRFGKERYWEDICYPEKTWEKKAGDCRCRGLWSGSACDEEADPTVTFIVSSVMLVVTTILIVVCICFRAEMRSTKYASHHYRDPVMKGALSYSLTLQVRSQVLHLTHSLICTLAPAPLHPNQPTYQPTNQPTRLKCAVTPCHGVCGVVVSRMASHVGRIGWSDDRAAARHGGQGACGRAHAAHIDASRRGQNHRTAGQGDRDPGHHPVRREDLWARR